MITPDSSDHLLTTEDDERQEAEEGDGLLPVEKIPGGVFPSLHGPVSDPASCGVQRVSYTDLQPPALLLYLPDQAPRQDHQGRLHCLQFAEKPGVARDEDIFHKSGTGNQSVKLICPLPALRVTIFCHVRFRVAHELKRLTFNSCFSKDCIAPDMEDVVIEEL